MHRSLALILISSTAFSAEFKQSVVISIDGKEISVEDGCQISVGDKKLSVKIADFKRFIGSGYEFEIPAHYSLEEDASDKQCVAYTFNGKNVVFDIYELEKGADTRGFVTTLTKTLQETLKVKNPESKNQMISRSWARMFLEL